MNTVQRIICTMLLSAVAPASFAALSIDSLNYPVWVERGELSMPAAPGDELRVGDVVQTGATGRAWLTVDDGSVVKLGQSTRFVVERAGFLETGADSVFDAAFSVLKGAFRFTSNFFTAVRPAKHDVDFKVGAVTIGVRGTDIWGRSGDDEDFVALIEGSIEAGSQGTAPQRMDQALTLYRKAAGEPADPVQAVELEVVLSLAPETEMSAADGIANRGGRYVLVLASVSSGADAQASLQRFRQAGYPVTPRAVEVEGIPRTWIQLGGLVDLDAARNLRDRMVADDIVDGAWISRDR